jgi:hypothetical protein
MFNLKMLSTAIVLALGLSGVAVAAETSSQNSQSSSAENALKAMTSTKKKSRKKKVAICAECGKPETQCECDHHDEEGKEKHEDGHADH